MHTYQRLFQVALVAFLMGISFVGGYRAKSAVSTSPPVQAGLSSPSVVLASLTDSQGPGLLTRGVDPEIMSVFKETLYHLKQKYVEPIDSPWFDTGDLKDLDSLATKLKEARDPVSRYVRDRLAPDTLRLVADYQTEGPPSMRLYRALLDEFNQILKDPSFYDARRFAQLSLDKQTRELIDQRPQKEQLAHLNRLLLEQAYPGEITRSVDDQKLIHGAIRGMLATLDPYTRFMDPSDYDEFMEENRGQFQGIGALLGMEKDTQRIVVVTVFEGNPAAEAGLEAGDYIVGIDGVDAQSMSLEAAVARIKGPAGTPVTLKIMRRRIESGGSRYKLLSIDAGDGENDGLRCPHCQQPLQLAEEASHLEPVDITIHRGHVAIPILEHRMLEDQIGYVWLKMFNDRASEESARAIRDLLRQGMRGLILDLRRNPGGLLDMAVDVSSQFVPDGPVVFIKERDREATPIHASGRSYLNLQRPLVVLVDGQSASASEIVAGAVQDYGMGTVIGQPTYGKGLVQTVIELTDQSALVITTAKYLTPNHRDINQSGIEPDIEVKLPETFNLRHFGSEQDPQVRKALEILGQKLEKKPAVAAGEPAGQTL